MSSRTVRGHGSSLSFDQAKPADQPRLSDTKWLNDRNIKHLRGAPYNPITQGKTERWHQTLKNPKTESYWKNYFLPGDLEAQIAGFIVLRDSGRS